MTTSLTEDLKQRFAGHLSEGEKQVCTCIRELLRAALSGQVGFSDALIDLRIGLSELRDFHYDAEEAAASGVFVPALQKRVETLGGKKIAATPLSIAERNFLEDADGLIDWATRNGVSFTVVLRILGHDVSELARDDFQIEKTLGPGRCVTLKVTGWARRNTDPVGEADEQV